ncbi:hypothetical protein CYMTET_34318 [Cymbomonas tetramitiformis]|uniref:alpha-1,2-Mannosidase n=1 Tax=Cymbomonas tetramitiformis TaxID=36881 RepID=A0AAE0KQB6_9CHLO|nr:hypothetical protein CYMTET_34318 [Cymbomonas tetramitiformis]
MELMALSDRTCDPKYAKLAEAAEAALVKSGRLSGHNGLFLDKVHPQTGTASGSSSMGALSDSFYEYLLKVWLLGGKTAAVKPYHTLWEKAMKGLEEDLLRNSPDGSKSFLATTGASATLTQEHLACFAPGMLALGSRTAPARLKTQYLSVAEKLMETCVASYTLTPTGLGPDSYQFDSSSHLVPLDKEYKQRPEVVESLYILHLTTEKPKYREWGWKIFQAIERQTKVECGYAGIKDVMTSTPKKHLVDKQQSFFLSETLKYLYLLFSDSDRVPLDEWVFNTEAHPMRIFSRGGDTGFKIK